MEADAVIWSAVDDRCVSFCMNGIIVIRTFTLLTG